MHSAYGAMRPEQSGHYCRSIHLQNEGMHLAHWAARLQSSLVHLARKPVVMIPRRIATCLFVVLRAE
jgi:hypothetical protein